MIKTNKKGIFFTFAAIALSIVIIFSFNVYTGYRLKEKMEVTEIRIGTMNNFIKDLENDMGNAIFISGFRGLLSLEDYLMENGKFLGEDDAPSLAISFKEVFLYGTITTGVATESMPIMDNNTFLNWTERMKMQANKTDIELEFAVNSVTISHSEPWMVDVTVNLDIDVRDKKNTASWTIENKDYTGQINITTSPTAPPSQRKFVDPLYLIGTGGVANNTIRETTETFPGGSLVSHLNGYYYIHNDDAPSYLERFKFVPSSSSCCGIESLVTKKLQDKGLVVDTGKSAVDHLYFGTSPLPCEVVGFTDFYLDDPDHRSFYGNPACI